MNTQAQKIALITGGSRGLGRNTAESLARRGVDVVITYHSRADEGRAAVTAVEAQGRKGIALQLDTAATATFGHFADSLKTALRDSWGRDRFDFLINNAGTSYHNGIEQTTEADLDALYTVHLKGVFFLTQKLLPLINGGGRIVNLSSGVTRTASREAYRRQWPHHVCRLELDGVSATWIRSLQRQQDGAALFRGGPGERTRASRHYGQLYTADCDRGRGPIDGRSEAAGRRIHPNVQSHAEGRNCEGRRGRGGILGRRSVRLRQRSALAPQRRRPGVISGTCRRH